MCKECDRGPACVACGPPNTFCAANRTIPAPSGPYAHGIAVFALTEVYGPNWDPLRPRREQEAWDDHAAFMDALVDDGFVVLGGPIGNGERVLLVVEAEDESQIEERLAVDPWKRLGVLRTASIERWTIWLDGR